MFRLIFFSRLKCMLRDRQLLFWTFFFPVLMASLFGMAFQNLNKSDTFRKIPIAVVDSAEYRQNTAFKEALAAVSGGPSSSEELFKVTATDLAGAENSLKAGKIEGYLNFSNGAHVIVKDSGIDQTILEEFVNDTLQTRHAVTSAITADPKAAQGVIDAASSQREYLKNVSLNKSKPDDTVTYYYALIALACLYGSFWGLQEIGAVQANLSAQGARVNLAPVHKLKVFGYSLCAATLVQFVSVAVLIAYMAFVIKVNFSGNLPYILLACLAGCCTGVSFGAMIGAIVRKRMALKVAVLIASSMIMSFLSGLMYEQMKYLVTKAVPAMAYINPGNLIADAFYSLNYYTGHSRFFLNVGLLFAFSAAFYLVVYFVMRRQKYESI